MKLQVCVSKNYIKYFIPLSLGFIFASEDSANSLNSVPILFFSSFF